jgi:lipopolysaccharide export LptBFGC system permease protein LptF
MKKLLVSAFIVALAMISGSFVTPAHSAFAAIAFDAATNGGNSSTGTLTFSHTATGTNRILFVGALTTSVVRHAD